MGLTASSLCCPHSHPEKEMDATKTKQRARESPCCPASPLESAKLDPLLSRVHLLAGCNSIEEHNHKIRKSLKAAENLHSSEGLRAMGFEYKRFLCIEHQGLARSKESSASLGDISSPFVDVDVGSQEVDDEITTTAATSSLMEDTIRGVDNKANGDAQASFTIIPSPTDTSNMDSDAASQNVSIQGADDGDDDENDDSMPLEYSMRLRTGESDVKDDIRSTSSVIGTGDHLTVAESVWDEFSLVDLKYCLNCRRKLMHIQSGTLIDDRSRPDFIADGIMYDRVAILCQEAAQDAMCEDYDLEWKHVAPPSHNGERPEIRAMVSKPPADEKSGTTGTLFIVTGRGAVKAGIFSRKALVAGEGLETGSAWHLLREASLRRMKIIIPDPNCRGDRWGYDVVRQTFRALWPKDPHEDVYMIIHSAGGSNVQRFLLDTPETAETHLPQIQAMALTDSTHNLQWCKNQPKWKDFWESERCIYLKSAQLMRDADGSRWYLHAAGTPIQTDSFWKHRFGNILTCNAGTNVHAMTNWFGHQPIWKHLDAVWKQRQQEKQQSG